MVSDTIDDLPDPDTPVNTVILFLGMSRETLRRLCSRAPRTRIVSVKVSGMPTTMPERMAMTPAYL
jgi:hypothetical protein